MTAANYALNDARCIGLIPFETPIFLSKSAHFTSKINLLRHIVTAKHQKQKNYLTKKFALHIIIQTIYRGETWEQSRVRSPLNEKRQTNISFVVYFFIKLQIQSFCLCICRFSVRSSNDGMFLHRLSCECSP